MNRRDHILIGIAFSLPFILLQYYFGFLGITQEQIVRQGVYYLGASIFGSVTPDVMEPATDYKHRKAFHQKGLLKALLIPIAIYGVASFTYLSYLASYVFYFVLGYWLHLIADSRTKMGLPSNLKIYKLLKKF